MSEAVVDFSVVHDLPKFSQPRKAEGEYLGVITSFTDAKSKAGNKMWVFGITLRQDSSAVYPLYCTFDTKSLWKLRNLLMACGEVVPKKNLRVRGDRLIGRDIGLCLEDDEFRGRQISVITTLFPASEYIYNADDEGDDLGDLLDDEAEDETEQEWTLCGLCGDVNPPEEFIKPGQRGYNPKRPTCGVCRQVMPDYADKILTKLDEAWEVWNKTVRELRDETIQMNDNQVNVWESGFLVPLLGENTGREEIRQAVNLAIDHANSERLRAEAEGQ